MFSGFSPETVDFLWGIRLNNNREWFLQNKQNYVNYLYEPMKALGKEVFQPFLEDPGTLLKVSRIYRDARMHHPVPYKESLWLCIRQDVAWWAENPCLYFEITPDGISYGFLLWSPKPATMKAFRRRIAANPGEFLSLVTQVEESTGLRICAEEYKHPEKWEDPALERFYRWKTHLTLTVEESFSEATFSPDLADRVRELFVKLSPLYHYFTLISP